MCSRGALCGEPMRAEHMKKKKLLIYTILVILALSIPVHLKASKTDELNGAVQLHTHIPFLIAGLRTAGVSDCRLPQEEIGHEP